MINSIGFRQIDSGSGEFSVNESEIDRDVTALVIVQSLAERASWARKNSQLLGFVSAQEYTALLRVWMLAVRSCQTTVNAERTAVAVAARKRNKKS